MPNMNGERFYPTVNFEVEPNMYHFLRNRCNTFGNKIAWIDLHLRRSWTYSELFRRVELLRDFILENEICPSERIAIYAFNGIESCASLCALFILPRTAVLLRSSFNYREAFNTLKISRCATIITDVEHLDIVLRIKEELDGIKTIFLIGGSDRDFPSISSRLRSPLPDFVPNRDPEDEIASTTDSEEVLFLLPTSGTSGIPKLVAHTHAGFLHTLHVCGASIKVVSEEETALLASSLGHASGIGCVGCVLHVGATLVVVKYGNITFEGFRQACDDYQWVDGEPVSNDVRTFERERRSNTFRQEHHMQW